MTTGFDNIMRVFHSTDQVDLDEGLAAYFNYRQTMVEIASEFGHTLEEVSAAFAALSPNNDYEGNLRSTVGVIAGAKQGLNADEIIVSTYRACARRAILYLYGTPFLTHAKGPKIRSFYLNITKPWLPHIVTIDGHMVSVWKGERLRMKEVAVAKFNYERVADDFRLAATRLGVLANQVQSVCWFTWKRINRIVYEPQMTLLRPGDQWGLVRSPANIKPFARKAG